MKGMKNIMIPAALLLNVTCFMGVLIGVAYFTDHDQKDNSFNVGNNVIEIIEDFDEPPEIRPGMEIVKDVSLKNTGRNDCYVRVLAVFSDGNAEEFATLNINEEDWNAGDDGYYYYREVLQAGQSTESLFTKVLISHDADVEKIKGFDILVYAESRNVESGGFS